MEREIYRLSKDHVSNQRRFVTVNIEHFALSNWSVADFQRRLSFSNKRNYYSTWMSELPAFPRSQQLGIRIVISGQAFFFHALRCRGSSYLSIEIQHETPIWGFSAQGWMQKDCMNYFPAACAFKNKRLRVFEIFFFFFFFSWTDKLCSPRAPLLSCEWSQLRICSIVVVFQELFTTCSSSVI